MIRVKTERKVSVFLVESMSADDLYDGLVEAEALAQILRLLGVEAACRTVVDRAHLSKAFQQANCLGTSILHFGCHASQGGFNLTSEKDLSWDDLAMIAENQLEKAVLCLSACEAGNIAAAKAFQKRGAPPSYIVGPETDVGYAQACVAWSVFYHYLCENGISRHHMQIAMNRMNEAVDGEFLYRRWTGNKYLRYPSAKKDRNG